MTAQRWMTDSAFRLGLTLSASADPARPRPPITPHAFTALRPPILRMDGSERRLEPAGGESAYPPGNVDEKQRAQLKEKWGKMPEKERTQAMTDLTKNLDPRCRRLVEESFKASARSQR